MTPSLADDDDHRLAADLAAATGRSLLDVRRRLVAEGASVEVLRDTGDRVAHGLLVEALAEQRPDDVVLSEEDASSHEAAAPRRLAASRVWIVDPLDGTREFGEPDRGDWAVHVALVVDRQPVAAAVALPAQGVVLGTKPPPPPPPPAPPRPRIVVSRSRPPAIASRVAERLLGDLVSMGSAGAKTMAIVLGGADVYLHAGGQYEWDSAAPVAVARAAGLHTSRLDGSPLRYNNPEPYVPDLLVCRSELAERVFAALAD